MGRLVGHERDVGAAEALAGSSDSDMRAHVRATTTRSEKERIPCMRGRLKFE